MKSLHATALALGVMLSSCAVQRGPTPQGMRQSETQYEECMRTTDYPSECAYEKNARDFWSNHIELQVANADLMPPPYFNLANLSWGF
jgi:hypothetical protein